jgi:hypothetical protein
MITWRGLTIATIVLTSVVGCFRTTPVEPSEIPKLTGSFVTSVGHNTVAVRVVHVKQPDGSIAEIKGEFDLVIETNDGEEMTFGHPVVAELEGDTLKIAGGDSPERSLPLDSLTSAKVRQINGPVVALGAGLGGLALGFLIVAVAF